MYYMSNALDNMENIVSLKSLRTVTGKCKGMWLALSLMSTFLVRPATF